MREAAARLTNAVTVVYVENYEIGVAAKIVAVIAVASAVGGGGYALSRGGGRSAHVAEGAPAAAPAAEHDENATSPSRPAAT